MQVTQPEALMSTNTKLRKVAKKATRLATDAGKKASRMATDAGVTAAASPMPTFFAALAVRQSRKPKARFR